MRQTGIALRAIAREPLLQFLVLGALIFIAAEIAAEWQSQRRQTIVIDDALIRHLENLYHAQFGIYPDPGTRDRLVDNYLRDEVLYREAQKLGLAEQDEIIRRRLVQKMEFLLLDSGRLEEPDDERLMAYYRSHAADYIRPATVSFQHLYFSGDAAAETAVKQRAAAALRIVRSGGKLDDEHRADPFPLPDSYAGITRSEAERVFGQSEFARVLFETAVGEWNGPYRSGYGWHLVRLRELTPESAAPFTEVRGRVLDDWRAAQRQRQLNMAMDRLRAQYTVRRAVASPPE